MNGPKTKPAARSWIEVAGRRYGLRDGTLLLGNDELDIYAESRGGDAPGETGISLNGVPARGIREPAQLAGQEVVFPPPALMQIGMPKPPGACPGSAGAAGAGAGGEGDGERGREAEQVVYIPDAVLEVEHVKIRFGRFENGNLDVDLEGRFGAREVKAHVVAKVEVGTAE